MHNRWPVIVAIIVGSLIAISIVICIARCICCGAECVMCCCKCCSCCGSSGSGHKRMKSEPTPAYPPYSAPPAASPYGANPYAQAHAAAPPAPFDPRPLNQQYRSHAAPAFTPTPAFAAAPAQERPQFATFDSKPSNEDALPAMPSWSDARDRHVEVEEPPPQKQGDVELDRLNHNGSVTSNSMTGMAAVGAARRSPAPARSPISPIDNYNYNQGFESEPLVGGGPQRSAHTSPAPYGGQYEDYRHGSPAHNLSPVGGVKYAHHEPYDRQHSPAPPPSYHTNAYDNQSNYAPARSPSPSQQYNNTSYDMPSHDNYIPARTHTPGYPDHQHQSPVYDPVPEPASQPAVSAYPGQRSYTPQAQTSYPGQKTYQAFNPGQTSEQFNGVQRKGVEGSYREI